MKRPRAIAAFFRFQAVLIDSASDYAGGTGSICGKYTLKPSW
jgi:hypothetical protein